jgi:DNA-binding MarR family transcriptional regulator
MSMALTFASIGRRLERRASRILPISQYRVLAMAASSDTTAARLSRLLELAKPTITASVDALVAGGLLVRRDIPGDRRSVRLEVTATGQVMLDRVETELTSVIDDLVERCDEPELVRDALRELGVAIERRSAERAAARLGVEADE